MALHFSASSPVARTCSHHDSRRRMRRASRVTTRTASPRPASVTARRLPRGLTRPWCSCTWLSLMPLSFSTPHDTGRVMKLQLAGVQMDVEIGRVDRNLARIVESLRDAASRGAKLVVFPECALTGYCFESLEEAREHAEPVPGPSTIRIPAACREAGVPPLGGLLEADGERVFNACALVGPEGVVGCYRKIHLPYLGV